jgi:hypothetical protein
MTCYQRHMTWLFDELGLAYEKLERRRVDAALREVLGLGPEQHCPEVWAAIKGIDDIERAALPGRVRDALGT